MHCDSRDTTVTNVIDNKLSKDYMTLCNNITNYQLKFMQRYIGNKPLKNYVTLQ